MQEQPKRCLQDRIMHCHSLEIIYVQIYMWARIILPDTGHLMHRITTSHTEEDCSTTVCDCIETLQYGGRPPV